MFSFFKASQRPQSDAGESASIITKATTTTITTVTPTQAQQRRQQKKVTEDRVGLFAHLTIYTRQLERVQHASYVFDNFH